jgi:hypothetical protein
MTGPRRQLTGAALIGRRIGIAAFWCMAVFVTTASARSVILELYGTPASPGDDARCKAELRGLHSALLDHAGAALRAREERAQAETWLREWDKQFASTREMCAGLRSTRDTLQTLRKKLEAMLRKEARELLPLTERIDRSLSRTNHGAHRAGHSFPRKT